LSFEGDEIASQQRLHEEDKDDITVKVADEGNKGGAGNPYCLIV
jgi:hypothetical protein